MLDVYDYSQQDEWDNIVRSFRDYDVYWLSGYVHAFQIHGDGDPLLFYWQGENNSRAINVVMKRDISNDPHFKGKLEANTWYDFSTPYGYGGWLVEGEAGYDEEYTEWCHNNNIISEFVRWHPQVNNQQYNHQAYENIALGLTVSMNLSSPDAIFNNLKSENRTRIRKAIKNGLTASDGWSMELLEEFRGIYNSTMKKDNALDYYYFETPFYDSLYYDMADNGRIIYVQKEQTIVAACIVLYANGRLNYHLSGSLQEYSNLGTGNLMLYHAALWGSERGMHTFHLGGGVGSQEDNLLRFKRTFYRGDDLNRFWIGKKVFLNNKYEQLVSMRNDIENEHFFPLYRA